MPPTPRNNSSRKIRAHWQEDREESKKTNALPLIIIGLVIGGALIAAAVMLFSPHKVETPDINVAVAPETKPEQSGVDSETQQAPQPQAIPSPGVTTMPTETIGTASAGQTTGTETIQVLTPVTRTAQAGTVAVVDTARTRQLREEKLQEEIKKIHDMYTDKRRALLNEAVAFLRGNHTQIAVQAKAQNFRKLASELEAKISEFPKPSSEFEAKLHEYQKQELRKTVDFLNRIAGAMTPVAGDQMREKKTAAMMETWSVE